MAIRTSASLEGTGKALRDFLWLLYSELLHLRLEWFWYLLQLALVPLTLLAFLRLFLGRTEPEALLFLLSGSLVLTVSAGAMLSLGQYIGFLKQANVFEHYAALPLHKGIFLAALATRGVLLALPSLLVVSVIGGLLLGFWVPPTGWLLLLLSAYAMAGLGAFIGFWSPTAQIASLATQVVQPLIIFFAPVYYPLEHLPSVLQITAHLLPTTYAAQGLREALVGSGGLWPEGVILLGFAFVSLGLVPRKLDWRGRS